MQSNLLSFYKMPNKDIFNKWVMYLESVLKEVYSLHSTEGILLEALNYLALSIYFQEQTDTFSALQSPLLSPMNRSSMGHRESLRAGHNELGNFDFDQFNKVCGKIKELQAFTSNCAPEVLVMSQIVCGLNFEQHKNDAIFPIESEKSYLTALICLFHMIGDPRGRGNHSHPIMLLPMWKLGLLSLCTENRKTYDSEFAEELFDATLQNLHNHKMLFRMHQNDRLKRVEAENGGNNT